MTGIDPALMESESDDDASLELDGLYVDDIPRESRAASPAPGPKRKRKKRGASGKKRAAERRREREPDIDEVPEGPETTTALPQPESELGLSGTGPSGKLSYAAGVLQCTRGPEEGLALNLIEGSYTIGRARENNFVLKDIAASREHLRIVVENNIVKAVDLGSGNGTRVNGEKITEVPLKNGDRIEIGNSCLVFTYLGRDRSTSLPAAKPQGRSKKSKPAPAAPPPDRPPTQERIVMAAEKLAAELSERFRREDDGLDELPATSMERSMSNPRVTTPRDAFDAQDSFVEDDDMAAAIQQMAREVSAPNDELSAAVPEEEWADSETATRLPLGAEAAAARGYTGGALPPPMPADPSGGMPAVSHSYVVKAADVDRGSPLLMMLVAMLITVLIAAGGVLGYLQYSGRRDVMAMLGLSKTPDEQLAERTAELRKVAIDAENAAYKVRDDNPDAWAAATVAALVYTQDEAKLKELNTFLKAQGKEPMPMPPSYNPPEPAEDGKVAANTTDGDKAPERGEVAASDGAKSEDAKAGDAKPGDAASDGAKADGSKADGSKADGSKAKAGSTKTETAKADGAKTDAAKPDGAKADGARSEPKPKNEPVKVAKASPKNEQAAKPAKADPEPKKTASAKKATPTKTTRASKPKKAEKRATKPKRASPPPREDKPSREGIDDAKAAGLYKKAILALKKDDRDRACKFLKIIKSQAASDSVWKKKAELRMDRDCQ